MKSKYSNKKKYIKNSKKCESYSTFKMHILNDRFKKIEIIILKIFLFSNFTKGQG